MATGFKRRGNFGSRGYRWFSPDRNTTGSSTFSHKQNLEHIQRGAYFRSNVASVAAAQDALSKMLEAVDGNLEDLTYDAAKQLHHMIIARVPLRTGRLLQSVRVDRIRGTKGVAGFRAYAFAINPQTGEEYAVEQHENESYRHLPGRTAHYISIPFEQVTAELEKVLTANAVSLTRQLFMYKQDVHDPARFRNYSTAIRVQTPHLRDKIDLSGDHATPAWNLPKTMGQRGARYKKGEKRSGYYNAGTGVFEPRWNI